MIWLDFNSFSANTNIRYKTLLVFQNLLRKVSLPTSVTKIIIIIMVLIVERLLNLSDVRLGGIDISE